MSDLLKEALAGLCVIGVCFLLIVVGAWCWGTPRPPSDITDQVTVAECERSVDYHIRLAREDSKTIRAWYKWCRENMPDSPYYGG